jgi:ABC-type arginine transport system permease subunit
MCLLQLIGLITVAFAIISKQYSDHATLFWCVIIGVVLSIIGYASLHKKLRLSEKLLAIYAALIGWIVKLTVVLFIWFSVVVWI